MEQSQTSSVTREAPDEAVAVDRQARRGYEGGWRIRSMPRRNEIAVSAGAILGVNARFLIGALSGQHVPATFPLGTLVINLTGCLLIGIMQTLFLELLAVRREVQLFVSVGLLGGFTTFSTFSVETVQLVQHGHAGQALAYQALSLAGGIAGVAAGIIVAHASHRTYRRSRRRR